MSDFVFSTRRRPPGTLGGALERYLGPVTADCAEHHGEWGSLAVARASHDPDPVRDDGRSLRVLIGRPLTTSAAPDADPLRALLASPAGVRWEEHLDGPFALLSLDRVEGRGLVVSDLASFIPIYQAVIARPGGPELVLGTHLDAVALAAGLNQELDLVSAADLVVNLTCTFPHTVFRGVEQFPPATVRGFGATGGWSEPPRSYWEPVEREDAYPSLAAAAGELREVLAADVRAACSSHPTVGILLSGGEDARAVLGAVPADVGVRAFVFADWETREVRVAARVARAYGAELVFGRREPEHYMAHFEATASIIGSGQLFSDLHSYGFHQDLKIGELPLVLGGLSSDAFLKAEHAPPASRGDSIRLPSASAIRPDVLDAVVERRREFRRRLSDLRPRSAAEWEHLWPFSMRKHAANFHGNRRLFASHEPFQCAGVVKLAAAVPQEWKRRRALFHRAMRPFLARSWYIPHARFRYPFFGAYANVPLSAGLRLARGARALATGQLRASHGPWPKWKRVLASPLGAELSRRYPAGLSPLRPMFREGAADEVERLAEKEWHPLRRLLLLQLAFLTHRAIRG